MWITLIYHLWINYPHFMKQFSWKNFITEFEKNNNSPVLIPILKKTSLSDVVDGTAYVCCENLGMQIFLSSKKKDVEAALSKHTSKDTKINFFIKEREVTKSEDVPLIRYQENKDAVIKQASLQSKFTFANYAVSTSNEIAYAASITVSDNPGNTYNPLYIYGGVGVGKTHLTHAIANKILDKDVTKKIRYCSSEEFTNDLIDSIRMKNTALFRNKYRSLDVLIVDDIQFIAGKVAVQEEFFHTFNSIINNGGQIILTSDVSPKDINKLEDRLRSRFSGGLTIDVQSPDFELRTAIILIKAKERNIEIDFESASMLAERIGDTRELEGRLLEIYSKTLKNNQKINPDIIRQDFTKKVEVQVSKSNPQDVIKNICTYYDIKPSQLKDPTRKENIALPRQIAMYILRNHFKMRLEEIAHILKRKDHTTVIHGVGKITNMIMKNPSFKEEIDRIISSV